MRRRLVRRPPLAFSPIFAVMLALVATSSALAAGKALLKDIWQGPGNSSPTSWQTVNGRTLFYADDGVHGVELWTTDGTRPGTHLLKDIHPNGSGGGYSDLVPLKATTSLFVAPDGVHGQELWRTDATAAGTRLVRDIRPGTPSSEIWFARGLLHGEQLFLADDGQHGFELWKTDGTHDGTRLVKDIWPGTTGQTPSLARMWLTGGYLWIAAEDGAHGRELWRSDGTTPGTRRIADLYPGPHGSDPDDVAVMNGLVYFTGDNGSEGYALYRSSGPGNVQLVKDLWPQPSGIHDYPGSILSLTRSGNLIFFIGTNSWDDGPQLWKTDGTNSGTEVVRFIGAGPDGARPSNLTPYQNRLYFIARPGPAGGGTSLWRTDGQMANTVEIKVLSNRDRAVTNCQALRYGGRLYLIVDDNNTGKELWTSDGTTDGTKRLTDTNPGQADGAWMCPNQFGNKVYFAAIGSGGVKEWWRSDGTVGGTVRLVRFTGFTGSPTPDYVRDGIVYGAADDTTHGEEPWVYRP